MKYLITVILAVVLLAACQSKKEEQAASDVASPNTLTDQQKAEGWTLLFDGKTMIGWRIYKNKPNNSWEVADGALHCKPFLEGGENLRSDLITEDQYENYEFAFQWKIAAQGNSGVIYLVSEDYNESYETGPEYQVLDDTGYPGQVASSNLTGCNYDMHSIEQKKLNPAGEWNEGKIVVNNKKVEHWLNGEKVVEYEIDSPDWIARRDASKWKDFPGYGTVSKGHIALQDHGNEVYYRNIMIKALN
jgi:hypothetical protein